MVKGRDKEIVWDEEEFYDSGWDDWVDVQIKAVGALAELNAGEAVPDIVAAMRDENSQDMTAVAFKALARMGKGRASRRLLGFWMKIRHVCAAAPRHLWPHLTLRNQWNRWRARSQTPAPKCAVRPCVSLAARVPADSRLAAFLDDPDAIACVRRLYSFAARSTRICSHQ